MVYIVIGVVQYEFEDVLAVFRDREAAEWFAEDYQKRYAADFERVGYDTDLVNFDRFEIKEMEVQ